MKCMSRFVFLKEILTFQPLWSKLCLPSPGDLPNPGIEPRSPALLEGSSPAGPQGKPSESQTHVLV